MIKIYTTGNNLDNSLNFGKKDTFTMQNTGNFKHVYIARFEASLKYVILKCGLIKVASEMPVPHSLGKYFQHHEIQKHCTSTKFRILSEHCQLYKAQKNV